MTCRSVSAETWEHARRALVFYFSRRLGVHNAEDLAQETLTVVLRRDDFEFEREEDFLRVCYGFAMRVGKHQSRKESRHRTEELTDVSVGAEKSRVAGLQQAEVPLFLGKVVDVGEAHLSEEEWLLIQQAVAKASEDSLSSAQNAPYIEPQDERSTGRLRVKLHRARRKLAILTGWRKDV